MQKVTVKELEAFLRAQDIRPSYLRLKILEYFFIHHNHPSVNMIYDELIEIIPTLSKTSVYNTLSLYVEHRIIESLGISGNEQRYDLYRRKTHAHFYCEVCEEIYDVNIDVDDRIEEAFADYKLESQSLQFTGICKKCLEKQAATAEKE